MHHTQTSSDNQQTGGGKQTTTYSASVGSHGARQSHLPRETYYSVLYRVGTAKTTQGCTDPRAGNSNKVGKQNKQAPPKKAPPSSPR